MICERCGVQTIAHTLSTFNTEDICLGCSKREREHPGYERACRAEEAACRRGDFNFPGVGKPADL